MDIVKDQLLGEEHYSDIEEQIQFDNATVEQCHLVPLRAWDKVEHRKKSTSVTKIILWGSGEGFTDF